MTWNEVAESVGVATESRSSFLQASDSCGGCVSGGMLKQYTKIGETDDWSTNESHQYAFEHAQSSNLMLLIFISTGDAVGAS
ncbi:hypothetical protein Pan14r_49150 [Crateriforma conspicua]|uniref:Uncharacterized protein n=1 Tax=Crateriforma conspicua TaxID=2527996 RepID=A0A5C5YE74_9PLAN|nr:hypothetical protein Mal65_02770 [Crateriforma conspicua]TWT72595.1 hypothetical protein Pan14r_49150 [Crateriforma conspicua]